MTFAEALSGARCGHSGDGRRGVDIGVSGVSRVEKVGQGAFGVVYRAHQDAFDRTVAVKVLSNVDVDVDAQERFAREVRAVGRLSGHPHIVAVHAHGTTEGEGYPYLLMEFCAGGSYGDRLRDGRRWTWQEATEVGVAVAGALETSHRAGILHRDVKPDNILIDFYGVPKLADFGIARVSTQGTLTATGVLTGSPAHIAPELVAGGSPSAASDTYSLASTLHTMIAGSPPFVRETDVSILPLLHRIAHEPPPCLEEHGVPGHVAEVVRAGLAKDPADRPPGCLALAEALQASRRVAGLAPAPGLRALAGPPGVGRARAADGTFASEAATLLAAPVPGVPEQRPASASGDSTQRVPPPEPPAQQPPTGSPGPGRAGRRWGLVAATVAVVLGVTGGAAVLTFTDDGTGDSVSTEGGSNDTAAANALLFDAPALSALSAERWEAQETSTSLNPNRGFCGRQVPRGPAEFMQQEFFSLSAGRGNLPVAVSGGAVFDTAEEAAAYQANRDESASCGTWQEAGRERTVEVSAVSPTLVGCECQEVSVYEVVVTLPDGSTERQFTSHARQGRFIAAGYYRVAGDPDPFFGEVADLTVLRVNDVATTFVEGG